MLWLYSYLFQSQRQENSVMQALENLSEPQVIKLIIYAFYYFLTSYIREALRNITESILLLLYFITLECQ